MNNEQLETRLLDLQAFRSPLLSACNQTLSEKLYLIPLLFGQFREAGGHIGVVGSA